LTYYCGCCYCVWISNWVRSVRRANRLFQRPAATSSARLHWQSVGILQIPTATHVRLADLQDLSYHSVANVWNLRRPAD